MGISGGAAKSQGDANLDGDVDGADFLAWQRNLGKRLPSPPIAGDFELDDDVDGADFLAWQRDFGNLFDASQLTTWKSNYGQANTAVQATTASATLPDPPFASGPIQKAKAIASVATAQLIDAALATEWLEGWPDQQEAPALDKRLPIETAITPTYSAATLLPTTPTVLEFSVLEIDVDNPQSTGEPWLDDKLLERVFGGS